MLSGASNHRQACQCLNFLESCSHAASAFTAPRLRLLIARLTSSLRPSLTGMNLETSEPGTGCDLQRRKRLVSEVGTEKAIYGSSFLENHKAETWLG